ncbi:hypothetical protein B0H13DRAFT_2308194 [Mycena leptocephala]|nr:hypothetical protein B0H13DRAFT_2308194 [Mycena leptocephala]
MGLRSTDATLSRTDATLARIDAALTRTGAALTRTDAAPARIGAETDAALARHLQVNLVFEAPLDSNPREGSGDLEELARTLAQRCVLRASSQFPAAASGQTETISLAERKG